MHIELAIHDVEWCRQGHPVLVLKECAGSRTMAVAIEVEDARDIFREGDRSSGLARACALALTLLDHFGATPESVTLQIEPEEILQSCLRIAQPGSELLITLNASDGLVLARQRRLPIRMAADDFARVAYRAGSARTQPAPAASAEPDDRRDDPLAAFRAVVESLDLDDGELRG
jgi:hypothetical protein